MLAFLYIGIGYFTYFKGDNINVIGTVEKMKYDATLGVNMVSIYVQALDATYHVELTDDFFERLGQDVVGVQYDIVLSTQYTPVFRKIHEVKYISKL